MISNKFLRLLPLFAPVCVSGILLDPALLLSRRPGTPLDRALLLSRRPGIPLDPVLLLSRHSA